MYRDDWDENVYPLAYLLTLRTYGTWLHGDERSSVDVHGANKYGTPRTPSSPELKNRMAENLVEEPFIFSIAQRTEVAKTLNEVCKFKDYDLLALNIRTNHLHAVIAAEVQPEILINLIKRKVTRRLRELHLIAGEESPWSRGASRRYLWKQRHVDLAIDYVLYCQEDIPFEFRD